MIEIATREFNGPATGMGSVKRTTRPGRKAMDWLEKVSDEEYAG
jgi:hypothetical protein